MMGHLCNVSTCAELNPLFEGGHVYLEQQEVWKNSMYTRGKGAVRSMVTVKSPPCTAGGRTVLRRIV